MYCILYLCNVFEMNKDNLLTSIFCKEWGISVIRWQIFTLSHPQVKQSKHVSARQFLVLNYLHVQDAGWVVQIDQMGFREMVAGYVVYQVPSSAFSWCATNP